MRVLSRYFTVRTLIFSVLGAVLVAILEAIVTELSTSELDPRRIVLAAALGFIFSAVFERLLEAAEVITSARKTLEAAAAIELFRQPIEMLLATPKPQQRLVEALVHMDLVDRFGNAPHVHVNEYLDLLKQAHEGSDSFSAIMRKPVRWFFEQNDDRKAYLQELRRRKMKSKLRVFLIDDSHLQDMNDDIRSIETMAAYWQHTGSDVETYWIAVSEFQKAYNQLIPHDLGIFDDTLVISYDDTYRTLSFAVLSGEKENEAQQFFRRLRDQLKAEQTTPFIRIEPPKTPSLQA